MNHDPREHHSRPRSTKSETNRRISIVVSLLLKGGTHRDLREIASEKGWNVSARHLRRYMRYAHKVIREIVSAERAEWVAMHVAMLRNLFKVALAAGNIEAALAVLQDEGRLLGLYPHGCEPPAK